MEVMFVLRSLCKLVLVRVVGCGANCGSCMYMVECFVCLVFEFDEFAAALVCLMSYRSLMVVTVVYLWPILAMPCSSTPSLALH
jgi:hypothetical protein